MGIIAIKWYQKTTDCFKSRPSLGSFVLTIDSDEHEFLIEESRKFADKHELKFDIVYYNSQGDNFLIDMRRKDVEVVIGNTIDLDKFYVDFYNYDCIHPTVTSDIVDLTSNLKSVLSEIPNATISEEK